MVGTWWKDDLAKPLLNEYLSVIPYTKMAGDFDGRGGVLDFNVSLGTSWQLVRAKHLLEVGIGVVGSSYWLTWLYILGWMKPSTSISLERAATRDISDWAEEANAVIWSKSLRL